MEFVVYAVLIVIAIVAVIFGWWLWKNILSIDLVQFERVTVFNTGGQFSDVRGPGNLLIFPDIRLFIWWGPIIIRGEQIRDTHGQRVTKSLS